MITARDAYAATGRGEPVDIALSITGQPPFTVAITDQPQHGTAEPLDGPAARYTPDPGHLGPDAFSYTATGADGARGTAVVRIDVLADPPAQAVAAAAALAALAASLLPVLAPLLAARATAAQLLDALEPFYLDMFRGPDPAAAWTSFQQSARWAYDRVEPDGTSAQADRMADISASAIINHAQVEQRRQSGASGSKTWWTMLDERVRHTHRPMHGTTVPLNGMFEVGPSNVRMDYPGQPVGPVELWVNCRCVMTFSDHPVTAAAPPEGAPPMPGCTCEQEPADEQLALFDLQEGYELPDEMRWHGVVALEGQPTGDGRSFAEGSITWRQPPLPLRWPRADNGEHLGSVTVGTVERLWREGGRIHAEGVLLENEEADELIGLLAEGAAGGPSIDADSMSLAEGDDAQFGAGRISAVTMVAIPAFDLRINLGPAPQDALAAAGISQEPWDGSPSRFTQEQWERSTVLHRCDDGTKDCHALPVREPDGTLNRSAVHAAAGRIGQVDASVEQVSAARRALLAAYAELGEEPPASLVAAVFARGPGWVTNPAATARLHHYWTKGEGAAKVRWGTPGDFRRLRAYLAEHISPRFLNRVAAQWHKDALGYWPGECGRPGNPPCRGSVTAAGGDAALFADPGLDGPTPTTIDGDRIYGHLAAWRMPDGSPACHIGLRGGCTVPPRSASRYAFYRTGTYMTSSGPVSVGQITMGTGHAAAADDDGVPISAAAAAAHYDDTGSAVADVAVGEDEHGIWFNGLLRPGATQEQRAALLASSLSGDWRSISGRLELVAVLAVNVPGFPVVRPLAASGARVAAVRSAMAGQRIAAAAAVVEGGQ
jgi:hypothetical protein